MKQLAMKAVVKDIPAKEVKLPEGYAFVHFTGAPEEVADWKRIVCEPPVPPFDGDEYWRSAIDEHDHINLTEDMMFIVNPEGKRVATITLISRPDGSGYVHMVKALVSERGKGLGRALTTYAVEEFRRRGNDPLYLTTDDFRLAAIVTYLDGGFCPILYSDPESDMKTRWDAVIEEIKYKHPVTFVTEEYSE